MNKVLIGQFKLRLLLKNETLEFLFFIHNLK
jgi:hypothetical protein